MAQMVWAVTGNQAAGPRFYLLNANGPTLFRRAVRYAVEQQVDVILFSGTFEGAGNYDGRGPLAGAVDEAVAAGVIWANAAGNCGGSVYNGPVDVGPEGGWARFGPAGRTALRLINRLDENSLSLTLTWNSYRDQEDAGTDKDLDLVVEDERGRVVGESRLVQVPAGRAAGPGETKNPRERLTLTDLPAGEYRIRVLARTANFGPRDRLRLLLTPTRNVPVPDPATGKSAPAVLLPEATTGGEIYPPADHAGVLTVGENSLTSAVGPTSDGRVKPDVILPAIAVRFSNGEETTGTSTSAAAFAGVVAALRAAEPGVTAGHIRQWVQLLDRHADPVPVDARSSAATVPQTPYAPWVPTPGSATPLPPPFPLSFNQQRALKYTEYSLAEKQLRGEKDPAVIVSAPGGTYVFRPGGRVTPPLPTTLPPDPTAPAANIPRVDPNPPARPTVHALWISPSPRTLAELIRGVR